MPYFDEFGVQDTSPEMREKMYELLRQKTPEERLKMTLGYMRLARELKAAGEKWLADHGHERPDTSTR